MTFLRGSLIRHGQWWLVLAALVAFTWQLWDWFPGISSFDTDYQYRQAQSGHYTDWHPPIMVALWRVMPFFELKMAPMLVLHLSLYWVALFLLALRLWKDGRHRICWLPLLMGLSPIFNLTVAIVMKDTGLGVAFLLAFALGFWFRAEGRRIPRLMWVAIALLVFYGLMVRHNGYFGGVPLLIYLLWPKLVERRLCYIGVFALGIALTMAASQVVNYGIFRAEKLRLMTALQIFDLTGTAYFSGDASVVGEHVTLEEVQGCYTPVSCDTLMFPLCKAKFWESVNEETDGRWLRAMVQHPVAYLTHRVLHFNEAKYFLTVQHRDNARVFAEYLYQYKPYGEVVSMAHMLRHVANRIPAMTPAFALAVGMALVLLLRPRKGVV